MSMSLSRAQATQVFNEIQTKLDHLKYQPSAHPVEQLLKPLAVNWIKASLGMSPRVFRSPALLEHPKPKASSEDAFTLHPAERTLWQGLGVVLGLVLLAPLGCNSDDLGTSSEESGSTGEPEGPICITTDQDSQCTLTTVPDAIPAEVKIDGQSIPVKIIPFAPEEQYAPFCYAEDSRYLYEYPAPSGQSGVINTLVTGIRGLYDEDKIRSTCKGYPEQYLDPSSKVIEDVLHEEDFLQIQELVETTFQEKIENSESDIDSGGYMPGLGYREWVFSFELPSGRVGLLSYDLGTREAKIFWSEKLLVAEKDFFPILRDLNRDPQYILASKLSSHSLPVNMDGVLPGFMTEDLFLAWNVGDLAAAPVKLMTPQEKLVEPDELLSNGQPFSDYLDYAMAWTSEVNAFGDQLWMQYRLEVSNFGYPELADQGIQDFEYGRPRLLRYDLKTGERLADIQDFKGPISYTYHQESQQFVVLEIDAAKIYFYDPKLPNPLVKTQTLENFSSPAWGRMSKDGKRFEVNYDFQDIDGEPWPTKTMYYEYQNGTYVPIDVVPEPKVEVTVHPRYLEWVEGGRRTLDPTLQYEDVGSNLEGLRSGWMIYTGKARDYVVVNALLKSAYYFQMRPEQPCYNFFGFYPFTEVSSFFFSCELQSSGATVQDGKMFLGNEESVYRMALPKAS